MKFYRKVWFWIGITILILLIGASLFLYPFVGYKVKNDTKVYIRPTTTAQILKDSLSVKLGSGFADKTIFIIDRLEVNLSKRAGMYEIKAGMNPIEVARAIRNGHQSPVKITFNNIRTSNQFSELISSKMMFNTEEMNNTLRNDSLLKSMGLDSLSVVSILIPDTYEFYWSDSPEKVLKKFKHYYDNWWTDARKTKAKSLGLSPFEVSILASIVEEETAKRDERGKVARLYMNRLKIGMPLQADPTVKFALQDFGLRRITQEHLKVESPYNTYRVQGLPPGMIRLPEKSTLEAILNAPEHNYIYMCAKEDFSGYHNFTTNYSEHLNNARKYQRELNKMKIK